MAGISLVLALRNAAHTMREALDSILSQSRPAEEVLLILNGNQDETPLIAKHYAQRHPTIRVLESSDEGGVAEAARLGCLEARHPLLARMDGDDIAHPDRLGEQLKTLERSRADLVTCQVTPLSSLGSGLDRYIAWANTLQNPIDFSSSRLIESPVIQPGVLMRRDSYLRAGGYQVGLGPEDYDLWLRMLSQGSLFVQSPLAKLQWRDSPTRLTRSHDNYSVEHMARTKASHLSQLPAVRDGGVTIAGSGPHGRRMARLLLADGVLVHGLFDVNPNKIGRSAHGRPIMDAGDLGHRFSEAVLLGCVGHEGRQKVTQLAAEKGYQLGENYFPCC